MSGAIHPLPQHAFMAWCLVKKHRGNFTFTFTIIIIIIIIINDIHYTYLQCIY
jgi:hypothetical protein